MKTKALISCCVSGQLIGAIVFAYAKSRFSRNTGHVTVHGWLEYMYKGCKVRLSHMNGSVVLL